MPAQSCSARRTCPSTPTTYRPSTRYTARPTIPGTLAHAGRLVGGAAAALAAGLTPLELGSDIGGSIRNPSHFCGVYGHKPTWGVVPFRGHIPPPPGVLAPIDLAVVGPMARHPEDLLLPSTSLRARKARPHWDGSSTCHRPQKTGLSDFRVATWLDDPACPVDTEVLDILGNAVDALARAGARVIDRARPIASLAKSHELYLGCFTRCTVWLSRAPRCSSSSIRQAGLPAARSTRHGLRVAPRSATENG